MLTYILAFVFLVMYFFLDKLIRKQFNIINSESYIPANIEKTIRYILFPLLSVFLLIIIFWSGFTYNYPALLCLFAFYTIISIFRFIIELVFNKDSRLFIMRIFDSIMFAVGFIFFYFLFYYII